MQQSSILTVSAVVDEGLRPPPSSSSSPSSHGHSSQHLDEKTPFPPTRTPSPSAIKMPPTRNGNSPSETTVITPSAHTSYSTVPSPSLSPSPPAPCTASDYKPPTRDFFSKLSSITLENTGSTARDHLALERTFLAWLRTSLAFASIGIAITQLFRLNSSMGDGDDVAATLKHVGKPLGATFLGIAVLVLVLGVMRYYESQQWLLKGKFPASRGSVVIITSIAVMLIVASFVVILVIAPSQFEH